MSRRSIARRENKKRGVLPSFGDIILPVVSIAAVILLIIAGRQFFINGLKTSPEISSTRAYAEAPALIAEREKKNEPENLSLSLETVSKEAEVSDDKLQDDFLAVAVQTLESEKNKPVQQNIAAVTPKPTQPVKIEKKVSETPKPKPVSIPMNKQWRVQIGAYTSKSGAQEAAKKINQAGYKAIVYQNPASKHFKVWVQGGITKKDAERVVSAMQKLGYKGSFSFPPAK